MKTTLTLVVFVAFVLVFASLQSNAKRLTLKDNQRKLSDDRRQSETNAVPTAGVGAKDAKDVVADQSKGSGDTQKNTGSSSTSTRAKNNDEDDVNPTYQHYGGTGSNPDSSTDTHRYYSVDDRTGHQDSSSNDGGRKPKH
ncbi:hypothetical protein ABKV19_016305 [Rosa sericea]